MEDPLGEIDVSYGTCGGGWMSTNRDLAKYAKWLMTSRITITDEDRDLMCGKTI